MHRKCHCRILGVRQSPRTAKFVVNDNHNPSGGVTDWFQNFRREPQMCLDSSYNAPIFHSCKRCVSTWRWIFPSCINATLHL